MVLRVYGIYVEGGSGGTTHPRLLDCPIWKGIPASNAATRLSYPRVWPLHPVNDFKAPHLAERVSPLFTDRHPLLDQSWVLINPQPTQHFNEPRLRCPHGKIAHGVARVPTKNKV